MIECAACHATNAEGLPACAKCGSSLAGLRGGAAADVAAEASLRRDLEGSQRIRRIRRLHALVGAMTFFILQILLGLPESLLPSNLALNVVVSLLFGLPIGYLISRARAGPVQGALISAAAFGLVGLAVGLIGGKSLILAFAWAVGGILPGAVIGLHVSMDE